MFGLVLGHWFVSTLKNSSKDFHLLFLIRTFWTLVYPMQNLHKKDSTESSHLACAYVAGFSSWGNSTESHVQQSSISESLSLKMGVLPRHFRNTKLLSFQFQDHDSSSTQSTGQSYPEVAGVGDSNFYGQSLISASSGLYFISCIHHFDVSLSSVAG